MKFHYTLAILAVLSACENHDIKPEIKTTRLTSVTAYFEQEPGIFHPSGKTVYTYSNNNLSEKFYYTYDIISDDFALFSRESFTFSGNNLSKIEEMIGTNLTRTTTFDYSGDRLEAIHINAEVDTDVTIQYLENNVIEATYTHSNGRSFKYRISSSSQNIVLEQTFDDAGNLSSEIINVFDSGLNPLSLLGYHDPFFSNFSRNNKKETQSQYYSSAFPEMVPVAYEYIYNEKSLPTQQIITYKSYPNGQTNRHIKNVFGYEN